MLFNQQNEILTLKQDNERLQRRIDHQSAASSPHHTMERSAPSASGSPSSASGSSLSIAAAAAAAAAATATTAGAGSRHRSPVDDFTVTTG